MKKLSMAVVLVAAAGVVGLAQKSEPFAGRWDLTVTTPQGTYPSWLEVTPRGGTADVRIVGRVASVHPAIDVKIGDGKLSFNSSESFGKPTPVSWVFTAENGTLKGTQKRSDGVEGQIVGVRAPSLDRRAPAAWSEPEALFNGKNLAGWEPDNAAKNHWVARDGELVNDSAGANIRTTRKFQDFKLHIEYNCPDRGNSGVYLRGRYEIQVEYEPVDANDAQRSMGSIYGFLAPGGGLARKPGTWESYDVTLVGRHVTVIRDGVTTINDQEIPGITGGAIDSREGEPGPLVIQGDHTGGMKYRNIKIQLPR